MGSFKPYRRTALTAAAAGIALAVNIVTGPGVGTAFAGTPATASTAGTASAIATSYKVNPTEAALSIGITFGISLTGYTNNVAQAESRAIDLGIIGGTLAGRGCSGGDPTLPADQQPQALRADSRDADAGQLKTESEKTFPAFTKAVRAVSTPNSQSDTTGAAINAPGSFITLGASHSEAITRLAGGNREAIASVDIGGVGIAGVLELSDLKWTALSSTGAKDANDGTFTIGALKVLGQSLPVNDPSQAIEAANALLANLGIQISYPKAHVSAGFLFVDPLAVRVVPSPTRDSISQLVLGAAQPVRETVYGELLKNYCGFASPITVSDIVVGSVTGAGSFSIELGGVQTKSEALKTSSFLGLDPTGSLSNNASFDSGSLNTTLSDTPAFGGDLTPSLPPTIAAAPATTKARPAALAATFKGSRGGRLALIGLAGLLALLLVADRDRRLMRRAQRSISTEA